MISGFLLKRTIQSLTLVLLMVGWALSITGVRAAEDGFYDIDGEEHILKSTAEYGFEIIPPESAQVWALIKITPDPKISPVHRNLVQKEDKKWVAVFDGTVSIVTPLKGKTEKTTWDYRWELPVQRSGNRFSSRSLTADHPLLPYTRTSIALCRIEEEKTGLSRFQAILPLPAEWQNFVAPAYDYYQAHRLLFEPGKAADNEEALKKLLQDENPLLAVSACRTLVWAGSPLIGADFVHGPLMQATGWRRSIFTYLLLTKLANEKEWQQTDEDLLEEVGKIIDNATATEDLRPFALAAITAEDSTIGGFTDPQSPQFKTGLRKASSFILNRVFLKQKALGADYQVTTILGAAGFFHSPKASATAPTP